MTARKPRVLFVDDEPAILSSLRNLLHRERKRWELVFATSGDAALAEIQRLPFDVVVSDMRMPGMDGAALLARIQADYPATVRIMLTGHADREAIVRALPATHQLLSKPCEAEVLRSSIDRGLALASREGAIRDVIGKLDKLPSPPAIYVEMTRLLNQSSSTLADVTRVLERDPSMCAKVLQLVNSAYFGNGHATSSIESAVAQLGTDKLRYMALNASLFATAPRTTIGGLSLEEIQRSSFEVARIAKRLIGGTHGDDAFAAGLLHDIGQLVLAVGMPEAYAVVTARACAGESLVAVERSVVGADHAEVGAVLLRIWGLPPLISDAIRFHHEPAAAPEVSREIAAAIHVANAQVNRACPRPGAIERVDDEAIARAGLSDRVAIWRAELESRS